MSTMELVQQSVFEDRFCSTTRAFLRGTGKLCVPLFVVNSQAYVVQCRLTVIFCASISLYVTLVCIFPKTVD